MKRFLITTAIEDTWRENEPVIFLGDWCKLYSQKDKWSEMNAETLLYHWDDRKKLYSDYQYLQNLYELTLRDIALQLNQIHKTNHSLRYWRILIGPWLGYFIPILFDRWSVIKDLYSKYEVSETIVLTGQEDSLVPDDMYHFFNLLIDDEWNHHIYSEVLKKCTSIKCVFKVRESKLGKKVYSKQFGFINHAKKGALNLYRIFAKMFSREKDIFLISTYLPLPEEIKLSLLFKQIPQFWLSPPVVPTHIDPGKRLWNLPVNESSEFEDFARGMIPMQIPACYLEGYFELIEQTRSLKWPEKPELIFTSNSENSDDVFKAWAAEKVENGTRLVIGQHGGHYGIGLWSFNEDHQLSISDKYLSWGWTETQSPKVEPIGQLKSIKPSGIRFDKNSTALIVTTTFPRYSYWMYSSVISSQWLDYTNDMFLFIDQLPKYIQVQLIVRLFPLDLKWDQYLRWKDRFPEINLDIGDSSMQSLVKNSRVYISTYNATTFLESFSMNMPTVIFWNEDQWELRASAIPYFEELRRVGIFHGTPESAAVHLAFVWDDINGWWLKNEVQEVVQKFCKRYSNITPGLVDRIYKTFEKIIDFNL